MPCRQVSITTSDASPALRCASGQLPVQDADSRTWWAEHRVNSATCGTKHYRHPLLGDLTLDRDTWPGHGSGQRLMIPSSETGSPSHDALHILTSCAAERAEPNPARGRTPPAAKPRRGQMNPQAVPSRSPGEE
ncbi:MmyB family transcriptional regulator [Streptomyces sp. 2A115]|uniref:MmyB family transcriptional regulator n=1 Tax=Streptomyces sp. 2A115 TaxID=3457439 RepID=UPI003FD2A741